MSKFARDLAAVLPHLSLDAAHEGLMAGCDGVAQALGTLESAGLLIEATQLVAYALPPREAVWWACMCARHTAGSGADPAREAEVRDAAEEWVRRQTDATRRAAMARAEAAGLTSAEAWAAVAAFWSGDSMAPPDLPKVPPQPHFPGLAAAGSVALAAARGDARRREGRLRQFLASGRAIAGGAVGRLEPEAA